MHTHKVPKLVALSMMVQHVEQYHFLYFFCMYSIWDIDDFIDSHRQWNKIFMKNVIACNVSVYSCVSDLQDILTGRSWRIVQWDTGQYMSTGYWFFGDSSGWQWGASRLAHLSRSILSFFPAHLSLMQFALVLFTFCCLLSTQSCKQRLYFFCLVPVGVSCSFLTLWPAFGQMYFFVSL